ncbi:MAG: ammonium transporter, partial [Methylococcales bacterium]|nr:ammonium transporter [Methylococcales bacterium]
MNLKNCCALLLCLLLPSIANADELNQANTAWVLTSTGLVLFMTLPGLSLFYAGLVRSKNVLSVLMQCFAITCMVSILWLVGVYSLIFADGGELQSFIGGTSKLFMSDMTTDSLVGDIPETVYFMFQMTFAIITPALIVGAFAERMKFSSMLWFSVLWLLVVYVPVCHWIWGGGWLAESGVWDFAGSTVVHSVGGWLGLTGAIVLGPRLGKYRMNGGKKKSSRAIPGHSIPLAALGVFILWFGWFGFNAGS